MILIAILILILLSIKFVGLRAYLYANVLLLTIAWTVVIFIMAGNGMTTESLVIAIIVDVVGIIYIVLTLVLSCIRIPAAKRKKFCCEFTMYGFCLFIKWFMIFSIFLIPIWYFIVKEPMEKKITDGGRMVYVDYLGNGEYQDAYGNRYKEKE